MKVIRSNGRLLEIYDLGSLLMTVRSVHLPVKENGCRIVEDDDAAQRVRKMIDSDLYDVRAYRQEKTDV